MKKSGEIVSSRRYTRAPYPPLTRSPFPNGEGKEETASPQKKESQPRLAALGSPFQRKGLAWILPPSYGRRCPEGAEVGWGKRYERERGRSSQVRRLREHPIHRCAVPLPRWGRQRGGGFAAKKKANPASLRSAAPSKGEAAEKVQIGVCH